MTAGKVIDRLLACAPSALAQRTRLPQHCVLATMVAVDVLAAFDIAAEPLPVRAFIANRKYIEAIQRGLSVATTAALGGYIMESIGDGSVFTTERGRMWNGHLVAWVPGRSALIDLNLGAWNRPQHAIALPRAVALTFDPPETVYRFNGCILRYTVNPDDTVWQASNDYRCNRADLVEPIVRAIRRGPR